MDQFPYLRVGRKLGGAQKPEIFSKLMAVLAGDLQLFAVNVCFRIASVP